MVFLFVFFFKFIYLFSLVTIKGSDTWPLAMGTKILSLKNPIKACVTNFNADEKKIFEKISKWAVCSATNAYSTNMNCEITGCDWSEFIKNKSWPSSFNKRNELSRQQWFAFSHAENCLILHFSLSQRTFAELKLMLAYKIKIHVSSFWGWEKDGI